MKFVISGDSFVADDIEAAVNKILRAEKIKPGSANYEKAKEKARKVVEAFVRRYVPDEVTGVALEFDTDTKAVRVMTARKKK